MTISVNSILNLGNNVIIENIGIEGANMLVYIVLKKEEQICPSCKNVAKRVHDYRYHSVKDICCFDKNTILIVKKRRYRCKCGKRFQEKNDFLIKWKRVSKRLFAKVIDLCSNNYSYTSVSKFVNLSVNSVIRIFDNIHYPKNDYSNISVLGIDEFKGNTGGEKYNCIVTDIERHLVLDILPDRRKYKLLNYFSEIPRKIRENINYFVSDMWTTYEEVKEVYFKKSEFIVDKYHWIRQMYWAFENIRKEEQRKIIASERIYLKRSKSLLKPRFSKLSDEQKQEVNIILYNHSKIAKAYHLKEAFYDMIYNDNEYEQKRLFREWIFFAENSELKPFINCARTYQNWAKGIKNSLNSKYTNGFTEGCNNRIKVLKRNAFGFRNFKRFRNRILHIFNFNKQDIGAIL